MFGKRPDLQNSNEKLRILNSNYFLSYLGSSKLETFQFSPLERNLRVVRTVFFLDC